tara:strand:+ start:2723 stop:3226 length:504 start_codon:yes stop_codon:yes gene_type:complete
MQKNIKETIVEAFMRDLSHALTFYDVKTVQEVFDHTGPTGIFKDIMFDKTVGEACDIIDDLQAMLDAPVEEDMDMTLTMDQMLDVLNDKLPEVVARPRADFDGGDGIWIGGAEDSMRCDGTDVYDHWNVSGRADAGGLHPVFYKLISQHGWYHEAYDAGTIMLYSIK